MKNTIKTLSFLMPLLSLAACNLDLKTDVDYQQRMKERVHVHPELVMEPKRVSANTYEHRSSYPRDYYADPLRSQFPEQGPPQKNQYESKRK